MLLLSDKILMMLDHGSYFSYVHCELVMYTCFS